MWLAAPGLLAGDAVNHPGVPAVDSRVDGGHRIGHVGLDHLALLHKVAGGAVATLPHTVTLSLRPRPWVRGRGHLGSSKACNRIGPFCNQLGTSCFSRSDGGRL